jgi:hypothetical protein
VEVTILGEQVRRRAAARVATVIALLVLITGALIAGGVLRSGRVGARPDVPVVQRANVALARIAAVYRYPLGCLGARIVSRHPVPSLPPIDHADPCWRYGVYVTAILRRSGGAWRMALEAISASCPVVSLPLPVRAQLAVCRRPMGASP